MNSKQQPKPAAKPATADERRAAALRENLRKRKMQAEQRRDSRAETKE